MPNKHSPKYTAFQLAEAAKKSLKDFEEGWQESQTVKDSIIWNKREGEFIKTYIIDTTGRVAISFKKDDH